MEATSSSMDQKSVFIALILFITKDLQYSNAYDIETPKTLWAVRGSCVVIPCSYNYLNPKLSSEKILGIWYNASNIHGKDDRFIESKFPKKYPEASFIGDLGDGDCSIKIHKVRLYNSQIYKFRVEMEHFRFSYMAIVQLTVLDNPPIPTLVFPNKTIPETTNVTLQCSTTFTCLADVVDLVWSAPGGHVIVSRNYEGEGVWKVESNITFQMSRNHDGMTVSCHAIYRSGAKSQVVKRNLWIGYKPEILRNSHCRKNLSAIYCECAAIAKPPANITWHSPDIIVTETPGFFINSSSHGSFIVSRLEGSMTLPGIVWCTASNMEGSESQNLTIYDKPEILQNSYCRKNLSAIYCECAAIAKPPANITWHSPDIIVTETPRFFINSLSHGPFIASRLEGSMTLPGIVWCTASNMEGSESQNLTIYENPRILQASDCMKKLSGIYCECAAIGNPPANITWHSSDSNATKVPGFSITSSSYGSKTVSRLEGAEMPPGGLSCTASNVDGSMTHNLPVHVDRMAPLLIAGGILAFLGLCITAAIFVIRKYRSEEENPPTPDSNIAIDAIYQNDFIGKDQMKNTCDSENIYANSIFQNEKNVYTNMEKEKTAAKGKRKM
ncbi:myelin-associated glycoprotein-like [Dendropsophus ebraccatus]|uniref:myelin-associated glycoprotein-like n=1 Tax=Dendropsophus ebraccatus TaxID=150705 RepID=UPI0038320A61